jgi:hypothetical protein
VGFEVLTAVTMKRTSFWDETSGISLQIFTEVSEGRTVSIFRVQE